MLAAAPLRHHPFKPAPSRFYLAGAEPTTVDDTAPLAEVSNRVHGGLMPDCPATAKGGRVSLCPWGRRTLPQQNRQIAGLDLRTSQTPHVRLSPRAQIHQIWVLRNFRSEHALNFQEMIARHRARDFVETVSPQNCPASGELAAPDAGVMVIRHGPVTV